MWEGVSGIAGASLKVVGGFGSDVEEDGDERVETDGPPPPYTPRPIAELEAEKQAVLSKLILPSVGEWA